MNLSLSTAAADRIRQHLEQRGRGIGLRVGIRRTGCSGYAYTVDFADEIESGDAVLEDRGVRVVVGRDHASALDGVRIDYVREGLNEKFVFENPNAGETCGCGESFTISA